MTLSALVAWSMWWFSVGAAVLVLLVVVSSGVTRD